MKLLIINFIFDIQSYPQFKRKLYYLQIKNFLRELIFEYNNFNSWFVDCLIQMLY